ncbi:MAG: DMP19 family protein [Lachnospiraceae bacterium]|nr:DMP19 family protein [Lachnospiraceae bacterium]
MVKYTTKPFILDDEDLLWENFMCFARLLIPWEKPQLKQLSDKQKIPLIAFIYSSEVMGDGHISFLDLYGKDIHITDIIDAFKILSVPDKYIEILKRLPENPISVSQIADTCQNEEEFANEMEKIDKIYDEFDNLFYQYGDEIIIDKIIEYVQQNHLNFFEYTR